MQMEVKLIHDDAATSNQLSIDECKTVFQAKGVNVVYKRYNFMMINGGITVPFDDLMSVLNIESNVADQLINILKIRLVDVDS